MPTNQQDVELILRMRDLASKPVKDLKAGIDSLSKSLVTTTESARKGELSLSELSETMRDLERAQAAVRQQMGDVTNLNKLNDRYTLASATVKKYADSISALQAKIGNGTATDAQNARLKRYQDNLAKATKTQKDWGTQITAAEARLRSIGVDTNNTAKSFAEMSELAIKAAEGMNILGVAVNGYARDRKAAAAIDKEAEAQMKALDAETAQRISRMQAEAVAVAAFRKQAYDNEQANHRAARQQQLESAFAAMPDENAIRAWREQADALSATTRGYRTLADAAMPAKEMISSTESTLKAILDPAGAARQSLGGLEGEVSKLAREISAIDGPLENFSGHMRELKAQAAAASEQGKLIDAYREQKATVDALAKSYQAAVADVERYAEAIRSDTSRGVVPDQSVAGQSKAAQQAARQTTEELVRQREALAELSAQLERTGVDVNKLDEDEARLVNVARQLTTSTETLQRAHNQFGNAVEQVGRKSSGLFGSQRETLSIWQRIRGELLGVTASYLGVIGAIDELRSMTESYINKQAALNQLAVATAKDGDTIAETTRKAAEEYKYVTEQATKFGVGINQLAPAYGRFAIAAKGAGLSLAETRTIFQDFTTALRVNHASTEEISNTYLELQHMLSRNKVEMMDLNRVAANVPGTENAMARGLGISVASMFKMMKEGSLDAKVAVLSAGEELRKQYAEQLPGALKSLQAELGRLQTAWTGFQLKIMGDEGSGGAADGMIAVIRKITAALSGEGSDQLAKNITKALNDVSDSLLFLLEHLRAVEVTLAVVFGYKAVAGVIRMGVELYEAGEKAYEFGGKVAATGEKFRAYTAAQNAAKIATAETAVAIEGETVALGGATAAATVASTTMKGFAAILTAIPQIITIAIVVTGAWEAGKAIQDALVQNSSGYRNWAFATLAKEQMYKDMQKFQSDWTASGKSSSDPGLQAGLDKIKQDAMAQLHATVELSEQAKKDNLTLDEELEKRAKLQKQAQDGPVPGLLTVEQLDKLKSMQDQFDEVVKRQRIALDKMNQDAGAGVQGASYLAKVQAQRLANQKELADIAAKLKAQAQQIPGLPASDYNNFAGGLDTAAAAAAPFVNTDTDKLEKEQETAAQDLVNKLNEIDAKALAMQKSDIEAQVAAVKAAYQHVYDDLEKYKQKFGATPINGKSVAEYQKELDAVVRQEQEEVALKAAMSGVNDLMAERKDIQDQMVSDKSGKPADDLQQMVSKTAALNIEIKNLASTTYSQVLKVAGMKPSPEMKKLLEDLKYVAQTGEKPGESAEDVTDRFNAEKMKPIDSTVEARKNAVEAAQALRDAGVIDNDEMIRRQKQAYDDSSASLKTLIAELQQMLDLEKQLGIIGLATYDAMSTKLKLLAADTNYVNPIVKELNQAFDKDLVNAADSAFNSIGKSLGDLITHTESWKQAIKGVEQGFADAVASILKDLAEIILKQELLQALGIGGAGSSASGGGGPGGFLANLFGFGGGGSSGVPSQDTIDANALDAGGTGVTADGLDGAGSGGLSGIFDWIGSLFHEGGTVGETRTATRAVPALSYAFAPRLHSGSMFKSDEYPAILQAGEKVLSKSDLRAARAASAGANGSQVSIKNILVDDTQGALQHLASPAGEKIVLQHLKRNRQTVRSMVN